MPAGGSSRLAEEIRGHAVSALAGCRHRPGDPELATLPEALAQPALGEKGTNLQVAQEALGHTSLQTTSVRISLARDLMDEKLQANAL